MRRQRWTRKRALGLIVLLGILVAASALAQGDPPPICPARPCPGGLTAAPEPMDENRPHHDLLATLGIGVVVGIYFFVLRLKRS